MSELLLLATVGTISGALNVVAGGGSFLTLPVLLFMGLPAGDANGTNRVGVLAQNIGGVWGFHRHGRLDWRWSLIASGPAIVGAGLGAWGALVVPDFAFKRILSMAMLAITLWSLLARQQSATARVLPPTHPVVMIGSFVVGIYGGFIQAGLGFLVLAITTFAGIGLVRGNAVKVLFVLLVTVLSLAVFASAGRVDWWRGAALGAGNFAGALVGVRLAVLKGHEWLRHVSTAAVVVFAVLLWFA